MAKSGDVFQQIQERLESDLDEVVDDEERDRQEKKHYLFKMYQQLERYLKELPVEVINSGKYDVNARKVDFFAEMSPVFKNTHVSRDDIGDHMKTYAEEQGIMNQKKKCMIGSIYGERIMVISPLLGDLVGSLVDPLAAELVFLPETVVGLTAQSYDSITAVLFFNQPWCPLIVGCMLWSVVPWKPVHTTSAEVK
jgi:hypothetical protein